MFATEVYPANVVERYELILRQHASLVKDEHDFIANMANTSALLYSALPDVNWVGFYRMTETCLLLGPFQGLPACIRLPLNRGVCAKAAETGHILCVNDVHLFEGHIACDSASQSELVIPLVKDSKVISVLDIDSPIQNRFSNTDIHYLSHVVNCLLNSMQ